MNKPSKQQKALQQVTEPNTDIVHVCWGQLPNCLIIEGTLRRRIYFFYVYLLQLKFWFLKKINVNNSLSWRTVSDRIGQMPPDVVINSLIYKASMFQFYSLASHDNTDITNTGYIYLCNCASHIDQRRTKNQRTESK